MSKARQIDPLRVSGGWPENHREDSRHCPVDMRFDSSPGRDMLKS